MTTIDSEYRPLEILAGVNSESDRTNSSTAHWTDSDKIRSVNGLPSKIKGWRRINLSSTILGKARSIFSASLLGRSYTVIGTDKRVYSATGNQIVNITPFGTDDVAIADSLATLYGTLANNPITTVSGSNEITIADSEYARYTTGETVTISGVSGTVNGIPDTELNGSFIIRTIGTGSFTVYVSTSATSSGAGGGASVVRASGIVQVTSTAHGLSDGDRISIEGATDADDITAAEINKEHIIKNITTDAFDIYTDGTPTSAVTAAGGVSTIYYPPIANGYENDTAGQGYGMGRYGVGRYGISKTSSLSKRLATVWYFDRFGDLIITTRGNQSPIYKWDGNVLNAPVVVPNAPTTVNYAFISNNILVTFGEDGYDNRISGSEYGDIEEWTSSSLNSVFRDDIEGAGKFISHVPIAGNNIIFTEKSCYTMRKITRDAGVWEIKIKDPTIGIISPMARVSVNGVAYWMSDYNFHVCSGGNVGIIPSNNPSIPECTILRKVFNNLNTSQKSKIFAWYNATYNEIWWHYPTQDSQEPNTIVRLCLSDMSWWPDTMDRTAAEYPNYAAQLPRLIDGSNNLYYHEIGNDADGVAMPFNIISNNRYLSKNTTMITGVVPDSIQTGDINFNVKTFKFPQSINNTFDEDFIISSDTEEVSMRVNGRVWKYEISGNELGQDWTMGMWMEELKKAGAR